MLFSKKSRAHVIFNIIIFAVLSISLISVITLDWRARNVQNTKSSEVSNSSNIFDIVNEGTITEGKLIPKGVYKFTGEVDEKEFTVTLNSTFAEDVTLAVNTTVEAQQHGLDDANAQTLRNLLNNAVKFQHFMVDTENKETAWNENTQVKGEFRVKTKVWLDDQVLGEPQNQAAFNLLKQAVNNSGFMLQFNTTYEAR
ncbi:hypothetical protein PA0116 [Candidatus Phytoplasma australiense]|uniref:Uncharacterized protein n=1 Tax=Phytoplasma australiense TaxID=59748 RepID=B1V919_PHYAS|nr:hypothetical protein PA0116 [Candidatus Phytoplasma australiense]